MNGVAKEVCVHGVVLDDPCDACTRHLSEMAAGARILGSRVTPVAPRWDHVEAMEARR